MEGDQWPRNDNKWQLLELYYPWFYDIEITEIGVPQEEGRSLPAQTFDVEATITNVGQFPSCCIGIDMNIGAPVVYDTLLEETEWPTTGAPGYYLYYPGYGSGWRDTHKNSWPYYYGFRYHTGSQAGGDPPQLYGYWYYIRDGWHIQSPVMDTTEYPSLQLSFTNMIDHYSGQGLYSLHAGYSTDGVNWYSAWEVEPGGNIAAHEVKVPIEGGSETTYIAFWLKGNNVYLDYWYIDNVKVEVVGVEDEYYDFMCQGDDLEPGQARTFYFDAWTPEYLAEETTAWGVEYKAQASIDVTVDMDPGNDIKVNDFKLDFWHDCGIDRVTSPVTPAIGRTERLWTNGEDGGDIYPAMSSQNAENYPFNSQVADDFMLETSATLETFVFWGGFWNGAPVDPCDFNLILYEDDGGKPTGSGSSDPTDTALYVWEDVELDGVSVGGAYYKYTAELDPPYPLDGDTHYWIVAQAELGFPPQWGWAAHGEETQLEEALQGFPLLGLQYWSSQAYGDMGFELHGTPGGAPGINAYIQPGTQDISAIAKNYGTFNELGLACNLEIWEYITDPQNGTKQYEDNETGIDLDTPLGGEVPLNFNQFTFAYEGRYGMFFDMPDDNDDFLRNNFKRYGVGVDDTEPVSNHTLIPPDPDGEDDWYVSDLEVFLQAMDPEVMLVSSGVKEINYKVDNGATQTITGDSGSFFITVEDDKDDLPIEFWAVDVVGNEEMPHHTFTVDMDQTDPTIDLTYECGEGDPIQGWIMEFTATALDDTSTMDRVEFFLNEGHQATVTGDGPQYYWEFRYHGDFSVDIRARAYDEAGNWADDIVEDPESFEYNANNQNSQQQTIKILQG
jgi:hypothetical protein